MQQKHQSSIAKTLTKICQWVDDYDRVKRRLGRRLDVRAERTWRLIDEIIDKYAVWYIIFVAAYFIGHVIYARR